MIMGIFVKVIKISHLANCGVKKNIGKISAPLVFVSHVESAGIRRNFVTLRLWGAVALCQGWHPAGCMGEVRSCNCPADIIKKIDK